MRGEAIVKSSCDCRSAYLSNPEIDDSADVIKVRDQILPHDTGP